MLLVRRLTLIDLIEEKEVEEPTFLTAVTSTTVDPLSPNDAAGRQYHQSASTARAKLQNKAVVTSFHTMSQP